MSLPLLMAVHHCGCWGCLVVNREPAVSLSVMTHLHCDSFRTTIAGLLWYGKYQQWWWIANSFERGIFLVKMVGKLSDRWEKMRSWNVHFWDEGGHRTCHFRSTLDAHMHAAENLWWRHQMEAFSALLALCVGNSPVSGEFPAQRPVTRSFDVFFDLRLNKRLGKQSWVWWFETPLRSLWRHCNVHWTLWYACYLSWYI